MFKDLLLKLAKDVLGIDASAQAGPAMPKLPPSSGPADAWIGDYWQNQRSTPHARSAFALTLDDVETSGPKDADIRQAAALLAEGKHDWLLLERREAAQDEDEEIYGEAEDFLQSSLESGALTLEFGVDLGGKDPTLFESDAPVTADVLTRALLDYRNGGNAWIGLCRWVVKRVET